MNFNLSKHIETRHTGFEGYMLMMIRLGKPAPSNDNHRPVAYGPHRPWWV